MKATITIELDGSKQDVYILAAIARAMENAPPAGFVSCSGPPSMVDPRDPPTSVKVHATPDRAAEAVSNMTISSDVTVEVEPIEKPQDTSKYLRELLFRVAKMDGQDISTAKKIAAEAAGVKPAQIDKDFPNHPNVGNAIAALEAIVNA